MFITDDEVQDRLARSGIKNESLVVEPHYFRGGPNGSTKKVPDFMKAIIGTSAHLSGTRETARQFGLSPARVHAAKEGRTSPNTGTADQEIKDQIDSKIGMVAETAVDRLMKSMNLITDESLTAVKAKDLSVIAGNLAGVMSKIRTPEGSNATQTQIIIYAPHMKDESEYEVVVAKD